MPNLFQTENLTYHYPSQKFNVIDSVSIEIESGSLTTIIGANGSGKSTFLKLLSGVIKNYSGKLFFKNSEFSSIKSAELAKSIAYVPQTQELLFSLTVEEMVASGCAPYLDWWGTLSDHHKKTVDASLGICELNHLRKHPVSDLSGGEKQRVWIAKALAQQTECIILDEPTAHLDIKHQLDLFRLLKSLQEREKKTIVIACHDLNLAANFGTHSIFFQCGNVLASGKTEDVFKPEILEKGFLVPVNVENNSSHLTVSVKF